MSAATAIPNVNGTRLVLRAFDRPADRAAITDDVDAFGISGKGWRLPAATDIGFTEGLVALPRSVAPIRRLADHARVRDREPALCSTQRGNANRRPR